MKDSFRRVVAQDHVGDILVSTVWLAVDLSLGRDVPLHYETMVFGGAYDGFQDRYATEDEALVGHADMLAKVRASEGQEVKQ